MNAKQPFNESKHTEQPAKSDSHTDDSHELVYFSDSETYSTTSEVRFIKLLILIMIQFDLGISNETCLFEIIIKKLIHKAHFLGSDFTDHAVFFWFTKKNWGLELEFIKT